MSFWNMIGVSMSAEEKKRATKMARHLNSSMRVSNQGGLSKSVKLAKESLLNSITSSAASPQNSQQTEEK